MSKCHTFLSIYLYLISIIHCIQYIIYFLLVFLTIGIPTIYRKLPQFSYLKRTLQSIVEQSDVEEKENSTVLIFLADFNETLKFSIIKYIQNHYQEHLDSGFMQILQIHRNAYPSLENLKHNYGDSDMRVQWRSKQAVDFAFMFFYGRTLSEFYIQIEDDVTCTSNFIHLIKEFIHVQKKPWVTLHFSSLGFIGNIIVFTRFIKVVV